MNDQQKYLKQTLISFQRTIVQLNQELRSREDNYREKEKNFWLNVMDILDACDRLYEYIEDKKESFDKPALKVAASFNSIRNKTNRFLKSNQIIPITFEQNKASRELCKVIETRPDETLDNETILTILKTGYLDANSNTVLRKAEVITVLNHKE